MARWLEMVQGTERCLWCDATFEGNMGWGWVLGIAQTTHLCGICSGQLQRIQELTCKECGRPRVGELSVEKGIEVGKNNVGGKKNADIGSGSKETTSSFPEKKKLGVCSDCQRWKEIEPWNSLSFQHRALYVYNEFLQEVMARLKYRGDVQLAKLFTDDLRKLGRKSFGHFDYVVPIPLKGSRHWERGFNQAEALAGGFGQVKELLERVSMSDGKQSKRGRVERIESLKGAFRVKDGGVELKGKRVLIVDDIYTTGATIRSAAAELYGGGAAEVCAVTVARGIGKKAAESLKT
ncbi:MULTISPECIES: ComF family protein [Bacillaceae]|uniref:ComF family protein n=1 Tax=Evansella alkalicola TaxID=745819 RepID=A0ABS6JT34_9BACI|nr:MULTISPECIES: ComF family protein [Bacillaceae]MBU9721733.1 ComF family protein [Bacillus alkalicola]